MTTHKITQCLDRELITARTAIHWYFYEAPEGVTVDDLLKPAFWAHVAKRMTRGTIIDVMAADNTFDVQLRVLDSTHNSVRVHVRSLVETKDPKPEDLHSDLYKVSFNPAQKWRVMRLSDKAIMAKDMTDRGKAISYMRDLEIRDAA